MSILTESTPACISKAHPLALIPVLWEPAQTCTLCEGLRKTQDEERIALGLKRWAFSPIVNWETNMESRLHKTGRIITDIDVNLKHLLIPSEMGLPWCAQTGSESACNVGELVLIHALGRSPGEGNGNPLQHPCLQNSMDRETWQATVHGVAKNWTRLSN